MVGAEARRVSVVSWVRRGVKGRSLLAHWGGSSLVQAGARLGLLAERRADRCMANNDRPPTTRTRPYRHYDFTYDEDGGWQVKDMAKRMNAK